MSRRYAAPADGTKTAERSELLTRDLSVIFCVPTMANNRATKSGFAAEAQRKVSFYNCVTRNFIRMPRKVSDGIIRAELSHV